MTPSIKQRMAALGIAVAAVIAIQGTVSGAGDDAPTCQTWHPQGIVAGQYQHTLNPQIPLTEPFQHTWNPEVADVAQDEHSWSPEDVSGQYQHTLNPQIPLTEQYQNSWNHADEDFDACLLPSTTTP